MKFTKMHGLGNDYIFVSLFSEQIDDAVAIARAVSDRHRGIGGDGLILIGPPSAAHVHADVRMEMYNADGSRSEMCGNGIRCVAKYAVDRGLAPGPELVIETDAGVRSARCSVDDRGKVHTVRIDMGKPELRASAIPTAFPGERVIDHPLNVGGHSFRVTCVSMGNPHAVAFVEELHKVPLVEVGPLIEHAPEFPRRINAHFVRVDDKRNVTVRTWERGSGATRACGSGACAVCVAGVLTGRTERRLNVGLPGGTLDIEWCDDDHILMTGPTEEVFEGDWRG